MDILDKARSQRIGGFDGELVSDLCDEVESLRAKLRGISYDHAKDVQIAVEASHKIMMVRMRVKMVLAERDGYTEALPIMRIEQGMDGINIVVANAKSQATDAALSRQVACTDGLGVAVPPAPTFENRKD